MPDGVLMKGLVFSTHKTISLNFRQNTLESELKTCCYFGWASC